MFNTSLETEFIALHDAFGFSYRHIKTLTTNAIDAAFCGSIDKLRLREHVEAAFKELC